MGWLEDTLEKAIAALPYEEPRKEVIRARWINQIAYFDKTATANQKKSRWVQLSTLVAGIVTTGLGGTTFSANPPKWVPPALTAAGLVTVLAQGLEKAFDYTGNHTSRRASAEAMQRELWLLAQHTGHYQKMAPEQAFRTCALMIEDINSNSVSQMFAKKEDEEDEAPWEMPEPAEIFDDAISEAIEEPNDEQPEEPNTMGFLAGINMNEIHPYVSEDPFSD